MPAPSAETVQAIAERLFEACTRGMREPTAALQPEEHAALLELHYFDTLAAGVLLQQLREHARGLEDWTERQVRAINFNLYRDGARQRRQREEEIDAAQNVVRMSAQRGARQRRARTHDVTGEINASGMTIQQMLETDSPLLVAYAYLKQQRDGRIWFDEFSKRVRTDWRGDDDGRVIEPSVVTDEQVNRITRWLHTKDKRLSRLGIQSVNFIIDAVANEDKRNEVLDWIRGTPWDGEARLESLLQRGYGAADTPFNRAVGRCWFVGMVARVAKPGAKVDTMPVFIGPQGIRKSQSLEVIGGEWYRAAASSIDSKDFLQELHGALVFEVPELHSMISSRHGAAKIKAVLSTRVDHFRLPYGLRVGEHKRTATIVGTTNNAGDWHNDDTGARRFWPVHCGRIDLEWLAANRAQLFAEALAYYEARVRALAADAPETDDAMIMGAWWNVPSDEQESLMDAETYVHPWQEVITARLRTARGLYTGALGERITPWDGSTGEGTDWGNALTVTRIGIEWLGLTPEQLGRGSAAGKTIGACMRALGWTLRLQRVHGTAERLKVFVLSPINEDGTPRAPGLPSSMVSDETIDATGDRDDMPTSGGGSSDDDMPF